MITRLHQTVAQLSQTECKQWSEGQCIKAIAHGIAARVLSVALVALQLVALVFSPAVMVVSLGVKCIQNRNKILAGYYLSNQLRSYTETLKLYATGLIVSASSIALSEVLYSAIKAQKTLYKHSIKAAVSTRALPVEDLKQWCETTSHLFIPFERFDTHAKQFFKILKSVWEERALTANTEADYGDRNVNQHFEESFLDAKVLYVRKQMSEMDAKSAGQIKTKQETELKALYPKTTKTPAELDAIKVLGELHPKVFADCAIVHGQLITTLSTPVGNGSSVPNPNDADDDASLALARILQEEDMARDILAIQREMEEAEGLQAALDLQALELASGKQSPPSKRPPRPITPPPTVITLPIPPRPPRPHVNPAKAKEDEDLKNVLAATLTAKDANRKLIASELKFGKELLSCMKQAHKELVAENYYTSDDIACLCEPSLSAVKRLGTYHLLSRFPSTWSETAAVLAAKHLRLKSVRDDAVKKELRSEISQLEKNLKEERKLKADIAAFEKLAKANEPARKALRERILRTFKMSVVEQFTKEIAEDAKLKASLIEKLRGQKQKEAEEKAKKTGSDSVQLVTVSETDADFKRFYKEEKEILLTRRIGESLDEELDKIRSQDANLANLIHSIVNGVISMSESLGKTLVASDVKNPFVLLDAYDPDKLDS